MSPFECAVSVSPVAIAVPRPETQRGPAKARLKCANFHQLHNHCAFGSPPSSRHLAPLPLRSNWHESCGGTMSPTRKQKMDIQETAVAMVRAIRECERLAKQLAAWLEDRSRTQLPIGTPDIESYLELRSIQTPLKDIGQRFQDYLEAYDRLLFCSPIGCEPPTDRSS